MIAQLREHISSGKPFLLALLLACLLGACGRVSPLPYPTPGQQDLVVLTQPGPLAYLDEDGEISGMEYDLVSAFALELGVGIRFIVVPEEEIQDRLNRHEAHMAAAWLGPVQAEQHLSGPAFFQSQDVLVQPEASLPITKKEELSGKRIHVQAGSRQANTLQRLLAEGLKIEIVEHHNKTTYALLEEAESGTLGLLAVDSARFAVALQYSPSLVATLPLSEPQPISWLFAHGSNDELREKAASFLHQAREDGLLERVTDRYLGHVRRLTQADILTFIENTEQLLPKLRPLFQEAQAETDIDWRLLAALAYQESRWNALATSPTGVRGMMMLTEDTADRLGVKNRLNAAQSIQAGARYLAYLREQFDFQVREPDRTWMALAAYNLGFGHFSVGRSLAEQMSADPNSWYEMKRILPLLAQPKYYRRFKSGRARGGEAVIMTENIRSYYDILRRQFPAYHPLSPGGQQAGVKEKGSKRRHLLPPSGKTSALSLNARAR